MKEQERIKIAIQKSGRLTNDSKDLLRSCGLNFEIRGRRLITEVSNFPADIVLLKDDDIPTFVEAGDVDLGIVGENLIEEYQPNVVILSRLGFEQCKLSVGVPAGSDITDLIHLAESSIATPFPNIVTKAFLEVGVNIRAVKQNGSVEVAPFIKKGVTAIADITQTGRTMIDNDLREIQSLKEFEAVLIANPLSLKEPGTRRIIDQFLYRVRKQL